MLSPDTPISKDNTHAPRISVVIPTYNRGAMLVECLESVLAQTWTDFEVIVIDDGSSDDTPTLVAPYAGRILYRRQRNSGVAAARNHGIRLARGEFVCFLDSDDKWKPEKLAVQLAFAESHPEYGLIATEIDGFDERGPVPGKAKASMYHIHNGHVVEKLLFSNWIQTSTVMVPRKLLNEVGGFDEDVGQFGEDWLLWMRIAARSPIYFLPGALVLYRVHQESLTTHRPELQYQSLMAILNRIAAWPEFQGRQRLVRRAMYRIAIYRGTGNLRAGRYELAVEKLRQACRLKRLPLLASGWLLRARIAMRLQAHQRKGIVL